MYKLKSNNIKDFPFADFRELNDTEMEELAIKYGLRNLNSWMLPQIVAYFGTWKPAMIEGLVDPIETGKQNINKDPWAIGLVKVCTKLKRSSLVKTQNIPAFATYSALVPLIMSGLKKFQNINYRSWNRKGLEYLVDQALWEAMVYEPPELTKEEILVIRERGLTIGSGPKTGTQHNPLSTWKLTKLSGTVLDKCPALYTTMLAQIWVAHPSLRSQYMILDPKNWDNMPDPLITTDIFSNTVLDKAPWE